MEKSNPIPYLKRLIAIFQHRWNFCQGYCSALRCWFYRACARLIRAVRSLRGRDEVDAMVLSNALGFQPNDVYENLVSLSELSLPSRFSDIEALERCLQKTDQRIYDFLSSDIEQLLQLTRHGIYSYSLSLTQVVSTKHIETDLSRLHKAYDLANSIVHYCHEIKDTISEEVYEKIFSIKNYFYTQLKFYETSFSILEIALLFVEKENLESEKNLSILLKKLTEKFDIFLELIINFNSHLIVDQIKTIERLSKLFSDMSFRFITVNITEDAKNAEKDYLLFMKTIKALLFEINNFMDNKNKLKKELLDRAKTIKSLEKMFDSWEREFDESEIYESYLFCRRKFNS